MRMTHVHTAVLWHIAIAQTKRFVTASTPSNPGTRSFSPGGDMKLCTYCCRKCKRHFRDVPHLPEGARYCTRCQREDSSVLENVIKATRK